MTDHNDSDDSNTDKKDHAGKDTRPASKMDHYAFIQRVRSKFRHSEETPNALARAVGDAFQQLDAAIESDFEEKIEEAREHFIESYIKFCLRIKAMLDDPKEDPTYVSTLFKQFYDTLTDGAFSRVFKDVEADVTQITRILLDKPPDEFRVDVEDMVNKYIERHRALHVAEKKVQDAETPDLGVPRRGPGQST